MRRALFLASSSPRRQELLTEAGIRFELVAPGPEPVGAGSPRDRAEQRAREKARGARPPCDGLVLGVDTVVALDGREFGKPRDRGHAAAMLRRLAGREHEVISAHCLFDPGRETCFEEAAVARVRWAGLSDAELEAYLDLEDWADKAGAYGIQSAAQPFVTLVAGAFDTVVGLHVEALRRLLEDAG